MDAAISDVVITLDKKYGDKVGEAVNTLKKAGLEVRDANEDNSVVEGTIDVGKVHDLEKLDCVDYVRTVFTYLANYPPGDPRDRDGV
ncbi:MAG TPA: hypothetical protein VH518_01180 [Tepidisphaeraceae bacterium]|jgi:hypothetical protein